MKKSCYLIDKNYLAFNGVIDEKILGICCEVLPGLEIPCIELEDTPEKSFKNWEKMITQVRAESDFELCDRIVSKACFHCPKYLSAQNESSEKIKFINISMYPSPCQSDCIYCNMRRNGRLDISDNHKIGNIYKRVITMCNYLKEHNKLDDEVEFQISSGEIAIHPFKNEILEIVGEHAAIFVTNGMKFDEGIAKNLNRNPRSRLNVSLDCGTAKTWEIVKKRDNFNKTLDNLAKYREYANKKWQIELKYIVLPGINTSDEDFNGIIEIMKMLDVPKLIISRNYDEPSEKRAELLEYVTILVQKLSENGLYWTGEYAFSSEENQVLKKYEINFKESELEQEYERNLERERKTLTLYKTSQAYINDTTFPGYSFVKLEAFDDEVLTQKVTQNFEIDYYLELHEMTLEEAINALEITKSKPQTGVALEIDKTDTHIIVTTTSNYTKMSHTDLVNSGTLLEPNNKYVSLKLVVDKIINTQGGILQNHSRIFKIENFNEEFKTIETFVTGTAEKLDLPRVFPLDYFMVSLYDGYKYAYETLADNESRRVLIGIIKKHLLGEKIPRSLDESRYFIDRIIKLRNDEIFVDGGACDGYITHEFVNECQGSNVSFKQIYAFDPDSEACKKPNDEQFVISKIEIINKGLWSENTELTFTKSGIGSASAVFDQGNESFTASAVTLDSFFENKPLPEWPTFIKLNATGSEKQALNGARKIIATKRPKMAICAYHYPDDIFKLIEIAQECNPNYEFTLRQHGDDFYSHVLYCVDKSK